MIKNILTTLLLNSISTLAYASEKEAPSSSSIELIQRSVSIKPADFPDYSQDYLGYIQSIIAKLPENHAKFYTSLSNEGFRSLFRCKYFYFDQGLNVGVLQRALFGSPVNGSIIPPEAIVSLLDLFPNQESAQELLYKLRSQPIGTINLADAEAKENIIRRSVINHQAWAISHYDNLNTLPEDLPVEHLLVLANCGDRNASDMLDELYDISLPNIDNLSVSALQEVIDKLVEKITPLSYGAPLVLLGNKLFAINLLDLARSCYIAAARLGSIEGAESYYNEHDGMTFDQLIEKVIELSKLGEYTKKTVVFFIERALKDLVKKECFSENKNYLELVELAAKYGSVQALFYLVNGTVVSDEKKYQLCLRGADSDNATLKVLSLYQLAQFEQRAGNIVKAKVFCERAFILANEEKSDSDILSYRNQLNNFYTDMLLNSPVAEDNLMGVKIADDLAQQGDAMMYLKLGRYFFAQGSISSAIQNFINGSLLGDAECLFLSGVIYKDRGELLQAKKCISQALQSKKLSEQNANRARSSLKEIDKSEKDAALIDPKIKERDALAQQLIEDEAELVQKKKEAARLKAEQEAARQAEVARLAAEKEVARLRAEQEAARQAEVARLAAEKEAARLKAEQEAARQAEVARLAAEKETARLKAEQEAARQAEVARLATEKETARLRAEQEAARQAEVARLAAEKEAARQAEDEMFAKALTLKEYNAKQALNMFLDISRLGLDSLHVNAMKEAAIILRNQNNFSESLKLFRMIEILGDSELSRDASYSVGCLLTNNFSQYDLAYSVFKRASDLGHVKAHYAAAMILLHKKNVAGVNNPLDLSISLLHTAASFGHVDALLQLSYVIANATETEKARPELAIRYLKRYEEALELLNIDPEKLHTEAIKLIQVDKNTVEGLRKLDRAADLGDAKSAYVAGLIRAGLYWPNFPKAYDHDKALKSFERGVELGDEECKFELALMISKVDKDRSVKLLKELLDSGNLSVAPYLKAVVQKSANPA